MDWTSLYENDSFYGNLVFNSGKASDMMERYKSLRYLYNNSGRNYDAKTVAYESEYQRYYDPREGRYKVKKRQVAQEKTIAEATFSKELLDMAKDMNIIKQNGTVGNSKIAEAVLAYFVAKDIQAARDPKDPRQWITMTEVYKLGEYFKHIPLETYIETLPDGRQVVRINESLFNSEKFKVIMKGAGIDVKMENAKELGVTLAYILWLFLGSAVDVGKTAGKAFSAA